MAEIKLLPCPFCGGKAKLHIENAGCYVRCKKCGAYGKIVSASFYYSAADTADAAVESWNRRSDNG